MHKDIQGYLIVHLNNDVKYEMGKTMKKLLLILLIVPFSTHCKDPLQEAIKEINLQAVKEYLSSNPLSTDDKEIYLYVLEQRVNDLNNEIFFSKFIPTFHSFYPILACAGACLSVTKILNLHHDYNYSRDGIMPVAIVSAIVGVTSLCWYKAEKEEAQYNLWMERAPIDALKIKQLIISA